MYNDKNFHYGHRNRLRKRILSNNPSDIPKHEMLEFLLYQTIPYKDTNELAYRLIERFGSFSGVLNASYEDLFHTDGIGAATASFLCSLPKVFNIYSVDMLSKKAIRCVDDIAEYLSAKFTGADRELVYVVCLDGGYNIQNCCLISEGTDMSASIENKAIVEIAFRNKCNNLILAHNHPATTSKPSKDDEESTYKLIKTLQCVGINILDHIVFSKMDYTSMASLEEYAYMF